MSIREEIIKAIAKATGLAVGNIHLETPEREEHGDYATNIALAMFGNDQFPTNEVGQAPLISNFQSKDGSEKGKIEIKNPRDLAEEIAEKLKQDKELQKIVEKIEVAGPGFINFHLTSTILVKELEIILSTSDEYGKSKSSKNKKIMVEFAHPNTHKAFHIGHLRNITLGESICRILEFTGYEIIRANYQGDVGMHIAKALWGIRQLGFNDPGNVKERVKFLGKAYAQGATSYEEDEKAKEEIHEINKKIYSKDDEEINKLYKETRQWSLDYFESIYKRVYTKFDRLYFESECYESGKKYSYEALEKGILRKSDGAIIFPGSEYDLHDRVFVTKEDVPTYEAKDFGLIKLQMKEYDPDLVMHVLGPEQLAYTSVIFKAQELLFPETKGKQLHVPYGWVRLKRGKMSSRTGKVVLGEQLLDDAKEEISKQFSSDEGVAEQIAVGAVKYSFLKVGREQEIAFDLKESVSLEGNSGPYIQYTFARTQSVLRKARSTKHETQNKFKIPNSNGKNVSDLKNSNLDIVSPACAGRDLDIRISDLTKEELTLLRTFVKFPETIAQSVDNYAPNLICNYLYDLAQKFNTFYQKCDILEQRTKNKEQSDFRLTLTMAIGQILKNGLLLLGIQAPKRM